MSSSATIATDLRASSPRGLSGSKKLCGTWAPTRARRYSATLKTPVR
jgi:hypothetical protein